ncbi:hypothetical protein VT84_13870 [Gemmata sp. SH-PL17]|nr:hypothetical protein VT84_13870 [Gemmata sp. SH-PL17]
MSDRAFWRKLFRKQNSYADGRETKKGDSVWTYRYTTNGLSKLTGTVSEVGSGAVRVLWTKRQKIGVWTLSKTCYLISRAKS